MGSQDRVVLDESEGGGGDEVDVSSGCDSDRSEETAPLSVDIKGWLIGMTHAVEQDPAVTELAPSSQTATCNGLLSQN